MRLDARALRGDARRRMQAGSRVAEQAYSARGARGGQDQSIGSEAP